MFAITGITGKVGGAAARQLLQDGETVRAVLRDPAKSRVWEAGGCEIAVAEMTDADALARAFEGATGVFVLIPPVLDPAPGFPEVERVIGALLEALRRARPGRVVCLSTIGAQASRPNLLSQLGSVEQALGTLDLPVAFLRAAWFMENAAADIVAAKRDGVIRSHLQPLDKPVPMVATADIGTAAAELLRAPWTGHRVVELEGPRRVSPEAIGASLSGLLGRPVRVEAAPRCTRMGGPGAPDDMDQAHRTQAWLAGSDDAAARVSSAYFYHLHPREPNPAVQDEQVQDAVLAACASVSKVAIQR